MSSMPRDKATSIQWRKGELIGSGAFGRVYMGMNTESGELIAVKEVLVLVLEGFSQLNPESLFAIRECSSFVTSQFKLICLMWRFFLINFSHESFGSAVCSYQRSSTRSEAFRKPVSSENCCEWEFLVSVLTSDDFHISEPVLGFGFLEIFRNREGGRNVETLTMLLEYVPGGSIQALLEKFGSFSVPGANILVDKKLGRIKLADLGATKQAAISSAKPTRGTPYWMAPEVIRGTGHDLYMERWMHSSFLNWERSGISEFCRQVEETTRNRSAKGEFSYASIMVATGNFSEQNKIGQGGFGAVYTGKLVTGQEVAVKRLSKSSNQGKLQFKNELRLMRELQHRNIIRILGFCIHVDERVLIYEYMANASLDYHLFGSSSDLLLDWSKCFNIIEGIAQGLFYLHKYSRLLIHNVKASNVLLDAQMYPKVADFGLAKICADDEETVETAAICGTMGYMAPEYLITGILSMKTCGSKATCASYFMLKSKIVTYFILKLLIGQRLWLTFQHMIVCAFRPVIRERVFSIVALLIAKEKLLYPFAIVKSFYNLPIILCFTHFHSFYFSCNWVPHTTTFLTKLMSTAMEC
ncbi:putative protein kinase RLK-Pelle-DLSV family [Rosa chinensis]|uniref:non-specific serine/threonine protein kinase n=1 Tax=Rosa chinensis TaxID=74649 RepID=A0A2P6Q8A2_ROSCH|nr:putative protein kinase RLK-Pelle-DLSV family [Rosa chinensis]